jgi:iron-sulfur cluster repair protein YtfE (RIC family)
MARLIDELKRDHAEMEKMLAKAKDPGISHKETHQILLAAQASLLAHLKKEDAQLYPVLQRAAAGDANLKRTVEFYAKDMDQITGEVIGFFNRYADPNAPIDIEFAKAFGKLYATISRRQRNEENSLYREFEKLQA